jgi:squalene-associated FAD-dependent desaturase
MTSDRVVVVGGGLAGITAAIGLAEGGLPVTLLESRPWLGGATWSFGRRGLTIDNGQHAFLRCFTEYRDLLSRLGVGKAVQIQERLDLTVLGDAGRLRIRRNAWPAPLHLARMLAGYRLLRPAERLAVVPAAMAMWLSDLAGPGQAGTSIGQWLSRHGQDERARRQFWDLFLVPALNATSEEADLGLAAGMINAALLTSRSRADLGVTSVPLRDLHGGPAARLLAKLGAQVRVGAPVTAIRCRPGGGYTVLVGPGTDEDPAGQLSFGEWGPDVIEAAGVVLAVPAWSAAELVPAELSALAAACGSLEPSPLVSIHVIYDSRVTKLPFAVSTDSPLRWIVDKTRSAGLHTGQYLAASVPAARQYVDAPVAAIREQFLPELERLFPAAASARVQDFFVTRERRATFRPAPGSGAFRPDQVTELSGFALAGAWTNTGWPDTLEGAVRSGRRAAESVLRALRPDGQTAELDPIRPPTPDAAAAVLTTAGRGAVSLAAETRSCAQAAAGTTAIVDHREPESGDGPGGREDDDRTEPSTPGPAAEIASVEVGDGREPAAAGSPDAGGRPAPDASTGSGDQGAKPVVTALAPATNGEASTEDVARPRVMPGAGKPARKRSARTAAGARAAGPEEPVVVAMLDAASEHAKAVGP